MIARRTCDDGEAHDDHDILIPSDTKHYALGASDMLL
jgi:hypothetical protein